MTTTTAQMREAMAPEKPVKDEPWLTLPTVALIGVIAAGCAVAAGLWAVGSMALGYGGEFAATGALGAGLVLIVSSIGLLLSFPWMSKPASTTMMLWLFTDVLSMLATIGVAYLLYSATFLQSHPLLLGVVLAYFVTLLGKVAVVASHMRKHFP